MSMKKQVVLVILLFLVNGLFGQSKGSFTLKHYGMNEGLSYSRTKNIVQDKKGRMWIGTWNGIDRFDGYTFRNFKSYPTDKVKLNNNRIEGLQVNSVGNLWVHTYGGQVFLFNTEQDIFENVFIEKQHPLVDRILCLDNGITWIIAQSKELYRIDDRNYKKSNSVRIFGHTDHPYLGSTVHDIFLDSEGDEWILTEKGIVIQGTKKVNSNIPFHHHVEVDGTVYLASQNGYLASYSNGKLTSLQLPKALDAIYRLKKLTDNKFAIITANQILIYDTVEKKYRSFSPPDQQEFITSEKVHYDSDGRLWVFASGGKIVCYDSKNEQKNILDYPDFSDKKLTPSIAFFIHEDEYGEIWILFNEGILSHYNKDSNKLELASHHDLSGNPSHYAVSGRDYLIDSHKNIWISTLEGFDYITFEKAAYDNISVTPQEEVRAVGKDKYSRLWIGKANGKIELYTDRGAYIGNLARNGRIVPDKNEVFGARAYCFLQDDSDRMWLGTREHGLFVLQETNERAYRVTQYTRTSDPYSLASPSVFSMLQDKQKRIWIGCYEGGLNLVEEGTEGQIRFVHAGNRLKNYPVRHCGKIRYVYQSAKGTFLIGTSNGLLTFSDAFGRPEEISFFHNFSTADRSDCLSNNEIIHIFQDKKQNIYISTFSGGIDITADSPELLSDKIRFRNINQTNGLASDLSLAVIEDNKGFIWVASVNAFSRFNAATKIFDHFNKDNLRLSPVITTAAPIIDATGNLIFGSTNGALRLLTDQIERSTFVPPIVFTYASIQLEDTQEERKLGDHSPFVLAKEERNVTVSFAALDYANSAAIKYAYRLRSADSSWVYINKSRSASFVGLAAGRHVLEVKSTNSDGVWVENTTTLLIHVTPTFWETGYAWMIYIGVFLLFAFVAVRIVTHILHLRRQVDIEHELTGMKLKFFTDISHELRTPLTLITNPIEEVLRYEPLTQAGKEYMRTAKQHTDRMLKLINQILDFRKIQHNKMKVYLEQTDIRMLIDKVYDSFSTIAKKKQIDYTLYSDLQAQTIFTDTDKVEKILFNLLSNAFKYTPTDRRIALTVKIDKKELLIRVRDEGSGFNVRKAKPLFERFETQNDADPSISSGIGLALVDELVNLMHGSVDVQSKKGVGSTFTVRLPVALEAFANDTNVECIVNDVVVVDETPETTTSGILEERVETCILVIEDNDELRQFMKSILDTAYKVLEAANGQEGLEITLTELPDIVISDIMMPQMDGVAYLEAVKKNRNTSHIPVILLTAKSSIEDQIKGIEYGADDYITKPFNAMYLKTKIAALVKQRQLLHQHYLSNPNVDIQHRFADEWKPSTPKITHYDDEFITSVIQDIEQNIQNTDFKIDDLASAMNMSRPVFYRKIKAIVGLSPIDFVKKIRIKRAAQLLETGQFSVAEVAYQSGFTTSQYLSKVFKETMGCSPKEYVKNKKNT